MTKQKKTALIIDFDNVYLGLQRIDPAAAQTFAEQPERWLNWIAEGHPYDDGQLTPRKLLIRHCYLNPKSFHNFRPYFIRSAFRVIDCPPLTRQGKTSADIHMVMDMLEIEQRHPHIDEYMLFSADADFTPLLLKLRAQNRETAVLAIGPAATAYKSACDVLINDDDFIEGPLSGSSSANPASLEIPQSTEDHSALLTQMAHVLLEEVETQGDIAADQLPRLFRQFAEFSRSQNWLGYGKLRALTHAIIDTDSQLEFADGDPWFVQKKRPEQNNSSQTRSDYDDSALRNEVINIVNDMVNNAREPISMAAAAHQVIKHMGSTVTNSDWAGARSFKDLLQTVDEPHWSISDAAGGFLYDPDRHNAPQALSTEDRFSAWPPHFAEFSNKVCRIIDLPQLTPAEYSTAFKAIIDELQQTAFNFTSTSKHVRDRCVEQGMLISRSNISSLLKGISYSGISFAELNDDFGPADLARTYRDYAATQLENAGLELNEEEWDTLEAWINVDQQQFAAEF